MALNDFEKFGQPQLESDPASWPDEAWEYTDGEGTRYRLQRFGTRADFNCYERMVCCFGAGRIQSEPGSGTWKEQDSIITFDDAYSHLHFQRQGNRLFLLRAAGARVEMERALIGRPPGTETLYGSVFPGYVGNREKLRGTHSSK